LVKAENKTSVLKLKSLKNYVLFFSFISISVVSFSQDNNYASHSLTVDIPEVAIIDLESSPVHRLRLHQVHLQKRVYRLILKSVDKSIWINYSSVVGSITEPSRDITVQIIEGSVPDGVQVTLTSSEDAGKGEGELGTPIAETLVLDKTPQSLIKNIGSAFTGNGVYSGHNVTYRLKKKDGEFGKLDFDQDNTVIISYTLTDN
jgi:hypothetical protein